jgi:addiction module HigA family antidote
MEPLPNPHPGDTIREDFMEPLSMTAYQLARGLGMTETAVSQILRGKRAVTAATALRLSRFLGCSPRFWMGLQAAHDLREARAALGEELSRIKRHPALGQEEFDFDLSIPVVGEDREPARRQASSSAPRRRLTDS